jgi:hypothetical protein
MEIPLIKAPEIFFDQQQWIDFIAHFESRDVALAQISCLPLGPTGFYQKDSPRLSTSAEVQARQINELFDLGIALINSFKTKLVKNQIISTGVSFGLRSDSGERVSIPPERWQRLWPHFVGNSAFGELFEFKDVLLVRNDDRKTRHAEMKERCIVFLRQRSAEGERRRKTLEKEALDRFGDDLTTRVFTAAYKAVFKRPRGRPRI